MKILWTSLSNQYFCRTRKYRLWRIQWWNVSTPLTGDYFVMSSYSPKCQVPRYNQDTTRIHTKKGEKMEWGNQEPNGLDTFWNKTTPARRAIELCQPAKKQHGWTPYPKILKEEILSLAHRSQLKTGWSGGVWQNEGQRATRLCTFTF